MRTSLSGAVVKKGFVNAQRNSFRSGVGIPELMIVGRIVRDISFVVLHLYDFKRYFCYPRFAPLFIPGCSRIDPSTSCGWSRMGLIRGQETETENLPKDILFAREEEAL